MEVAPNLPTDLVGQIDRLTVNRRGQSPDSFMITESIVSHVAPDTGYRLEHAGFTPLEAGGEAVECAYDFPPVSDNLETPPHTRLSGTWDGGVGVETANANILGNIGTLTLDRAELHIPEAPTTPETLGYYGACLLSVGDEFRFHTNANLPVTMMNIGHSYGAITSMSRTSVADRFSNITTGRICIFRSTRRRGSSCSDAAPATIISFPPSAFPSARRFIRRRRCFMPIRT
jgi:hypothetical protein